MIDQHHFYTLLRLYLFPISFLEKLLSICKSFVFILPQSQKALVIYNLIITKYMQLGKLIADKVINKNKTTIILTKAFANHLWRTCKRHGKQQVPIQNYSTSTQGEKKKILEQAPCRELNRIPNLWETKKIEKTHVKEK